ncbi:MAG: septal ring lytic transglycosylase RlpA family protein [Nitrospirae bacterium]|nr:septal ring lytic transglycosylase RlpA family protein [Nitrospirota bacterium]
MLSQSLGSSRQLLWVLSLSLGLLLSACSWVPKGASPLDVGIEDRGVASWYGESFHGKQAANGEPFDMKALTAAHRTLPLGSVVRVVNLKNGKHAHVKITDRGPYVKNRILDLSRGAAAQLGMTEGGLSVVRVQVVGERRPAALLSSKAMETVSVALILGSQAPSGATETCSSDWEKSAPQLVYPLRSPPGDIWIQQRARRVTGLHGPDPSDHSEISTAIVTRLPQPISLVSGGTLFEQSCFLREHIAVSSSFDPVSGLTRYAPRRDVTQPYQGNRRSIFL